MASLGTTFNRQMFTVEGSAVRLGAAASAMLSRAPPGAATSTEAIGSACGSGPHRSPQSDSSFHSLAPSEFQFQPSGHFTSRKNKFPVGDRMVMLLIEPLVLMAKPEAAQFVVLRLLFCCSAKPADG